MEDGQRRAPVAAKQPRDTVRDVRQNRTRPAGEAGGPIEPAPVQQQAQGRVLMPRQRNEGRHALGDGLPEDIGTHAMPLVGAEQDPHVPDVERIAVVREVDRDRLAARQSAADDGPIDDDRQRA